MTLFITILFALTYVGMALGRVPGSRVDRTGIAMIAAVVLVAMTPLLCAGLAARKLDARPFLFGLAAASNAGSAATLIGNPQNIMIGQVGGLGFWSYFAAAAVPSLAGLAISFACIAWFW